VPYLVNNSGTLSADVAAVLCANCAEAPSTDPIRILELGAGTGLFARYFLDECKRRCQNESHDYYDRLTYWITDRSPTAVAQWRERDVFGPHASHVEIRVADWSTAPALFAEPVRAVIANYLLGVLPSTVVRHRDAAAGSSSARVDHGRCDLLRSTPHEPSTRSVRWPTRQNQSALVSFYRFFLWSRPRMLPPRQPDDVSGFDARSAEGRSGALAPQHGCPAVHQALLPRLERDGFILVQTTTPDRSKRSPAAAFSDADRR
jgi:hypothetical protein